jgi:hypothetical protein
VVAHIQQAAAAGSVRTNHISDVTADFSSHTLLPRMISMLEHLMENATESRLRDLRLGDVKRD